MRFMVMVFGSEQDVLSRPPGWKEQMTAFMTTLDSELASTGELVYSEVLEFGEHGSLVDRHGGRHRGSLAGNKTPLARFWVLHCDEDRALEVAGRIAEVVGAAVEVRRVFQGAQRP